MKMSDTLKIRIARAHDPVRRPADEAGPRLLTEQADGTFLDSQLIYAGQVVDVPNTRYWRRRIVAGDVVEVTESPSSDSMQAVPHAVGQEE
jgi:hypothetical protein